MTVDLCPRGCYWECEHRASAERARLRPAEEVGTGMPLHRCRECGDYFYDAVRHGRKHERMRQLGWLRERPPARRAVAPARRPDGSEAKSQGRGS